MSAISRPISKLFLRRLMRWFVKVFSSALHETLILLGALEKTSFNE